MKIRYMGTAACERIPAMFCNCDTCRRALRSGGRNIMTRSQVLIDDTLLVDMNSETYSHFMQLGRTMWDIDHVLITHSHCDHLSLEDICCRTAGQAVGVKAEKMKLYTSAGVISRVEAAMDARGDKYNPKIPARWDFVPIDYFVPIPVGEHIVTPLPANHADSEQAFIYLIEKDGKTLFYGNDTGVFDESIDTYLEENGKHIDLLSLDCTKGDTDATYTSHMSMKEGRGIADRFLARGIIDASTQLYFTHFSHNCGMIRDELVEAAKKYGFRVTYDGLEVEF